ncbi:MAG: hypothetical protein ABIU05_05165 [Nitrospirales bacterium]
MTLQAITPISIRLDGEVLHFEPGSIFTVTDAQAERLLERAPDRIRPIALPPDPVAPEGPRPPLGVGSLIAYRDQYHRLRGGGDERDHGTVEACRWDKTMWTVVLTDGSLCPLSRIVSVGQTDEGGRIIAAWSTREHGVDGGGRG